MRRKLNLFLAVCSIATLGAGMIAFSACGDEGKTGGVQPHDEHVWDPNNVEVQTEATCTQKGLKLQHCMVTGCTATNPVEIPMKPHRYGPEKNTATCTEGGHMVQECEMCHDQIIGEETEALGHNYVIVKTTTPATCTQTGLCDERCTRCDDEKKDVVLDQLEHAWALNPIKSKAATCEKRGTNFYDCLNDGCKETKTEDVDPKGHTPDPATYEYKYPTFTEAGYSKGKCLICGEPLDDKMAMLKDGDMVKFEFKVVRVTEQVLMTYSMKITIKDWDGKEVATATSTDLERGIFYKELPVHPNKQYTMSVSGLAGYESGTIQVDPEYPVGELKVKAKGLYSADGTGVPLKLGVGNLAQDFELTDLDGETVRLSDYVKANKLVMLKFFRTQCSWCDTEFPGFLKAYNANREDGVATIGIAPVSIQWPNNSDVNELRAKVAKFKINFPVCQDFGENGKFMYMKYDGVTGAPSTVFIDHEGVIVKIQIGYLSKDGDRDGVKTAEAYQDCFDEFVYDGWEDLSTNTIAPELENVDYLPGKQED